MCIRDSVYGAFQTTIDLQSGAPVFGSPESQVALTVAGQLARRHGLPFRSGGMFASSKVADAQAAYESVMVMLPAVMARVNFVLHAAGWLEGGLTAGYEKFILDEQLLGMFHKYLQGLDVSAEGLATVSYTHLDVYKRQAEHRSLSPDLEPGNRHQRPRAAQGHGRPGAGRRRPPASDRLRHCLLYTSRCV